MILDQKVARWEGGMGMGVGWEVVVGTIVGIRAGPRVGNLDVVVGVEDWWVRVEGAEERVGEVEAGGADCLWFCVVAVLEVVVIGISL